MRTVRRYENGMRVATDRRESGGCATVAAWTVAVTIIGMTFLAANGFAVVVIDSIVEVIR